MSFRQQSKVHFHMPSRVFIFAGGGTGGHIFPAIAISQQVHDRLGTLARSIFVCSDRPLDAQILAAEKVEFRPIAAKPFGLHPARLARFATSWPGVVNTCRGFIREFRSQGAQVHIVALGGFVAAPMARAAAKEQVPITLVNLDAAPGKANRLIARGASRIFTAACQYCLKSMASGFLGGSMARMRVCTKTTSP